MKSLHIAALLLASASHASAQESPCRLQANDSAWVASALSGWTRIAKRDAHAGVRKAPVLVLFDERCTHTLTPRSAGRAGLVAAGLRFGVSSVSHGDSIALPNGSRVPAGLISFASPQKDGRMFFVMSLPSIWLSSGRDPRADLLATAVFMHEFTHTQTLALSTRIDTLVANGLPEESDDDVIQTRFSKRTGYTSMYERERDTLFAAATAATQSRARALAQVAMRDVDRRRAEWFAGPDSVYAAAEDVFLSLEGTGQWMAYLWLTDAKGGAMSVAEALPYMRRGGRHWSQDEGLALLLVAQRISPDAPSLLFRTPARSIFSVMRSLVSR
ncbi:MAG: hypothetical protein ABIY52_10760 [Gemmatimonadaceae bacterium]